MTQRLDERPFTVDAAVERLGRKRTGTFDSAVPETLDGREARTEPLPVGRPHQHPLGHPAVELRLHVRADVDAVHDQVADLAGQLDVPELDAAELARHHRSTDVEIAEVDVAEVRAVEPNLVEVGTYQVHLVEARAAEILLDEFAHGTDRRGLSGRSASS